MPLTVKLARNSKATIQVPPLVVDAIEKQARGDTRVVRSLLEMFLENGLVVGGVMYLPTIEDVYDSPWSPVNGTILDSGKLRRE